MIATIYVEIQVREDGDYRLSKIQCGAPQGWIPPDAQRECSVKIGKELIEKYSVGGTFIEFDKPMPQADADAIADRVKLRPK